MGNGESVVYRNKENEEILKVFYLSYKLPSEGVMIDFSYEEVLEVYQKWHNYRSQKEPFNISPDNIAWGNLMIEESQWEKSDFYEVKDIRVSTLWLQDTTITPQPESDVCILSWIEYIRWMSLQSLCWDIHDLKTQKPNKTKLFITDSKDKRSVKVWAEEIYRIGYQVSDYINQYIYEQYGIYCWIHNINLQQYWYTWLVPKNIKVTSFDKETWTLQLTITDWCASIILWYKVNMWKEIFKNFIDNGTLHENKSWPWIELKRLIREMEHRIARLYTHH